jgi:hypothetical protein
LVEEAITESGPGECGGGWGKERCAGDEVAARHPILVLFEEGFGGAVVEGEDGNIGGWCGPVVLPDDVEDDVLIMRVAGVGVAVPVGGF